MSPLLNIQANSWSQMETFEFMNKIDKVYYIVFGHF